MTRHIDNVNRAKQHYSSKNKIDIGDESCNITQVEDSSFTSNVRNIESPERGGLFNLIDIWKSVQKLDSKFEENSNAVWENIVSNNSLSQKVLTKMDENINSIPNDILSEKMENLQTKMDENSNTIWGDIAEIRKEIKGDSSIENIKKEVERLNVKYEKNSNAVWNNIKENSNAIWTDITELRQEISGLNYQYEKNSNASWADTAEVKRELSGLNYQYEENSNAIWCTLSNELRHIAYPSYVNKNLFALSNSVNLVIQKHADDIKRLQEFQSKPE